MSPSFRLRISAFSVASCRFAISSPSRRTPAAMILTHGRWTRCRGEVTINLRASVGSTEAILVFTARATGPRGSVCPTAELAEHAEHEPLHPLPDPAVHRFPGAGDVELLVGSQF